MLYTYLHTYLGDSVQTLTCFFIYFFIIHSLVFFPSHLAYVVSFLPSHVLSFRFVYFVFRLPSLSLSLSLSSPLLPSLFSSNGRYIVCMCIHIYHIFRYKSSYFVSKRRILFLHPNHINSRQKREAIKDQSPPLLRCPGSEACRFHAGY